MEIVSIIRALGHRRVGGGRRPKGVVPAPGAPRREVVPAVSMTPEVYANTLRRTRIKLELKKIYKRLIKYTIEH